MEIYGLVEYHGKGAIRIIVGKYPVAGPEFKETPPTVKSRRREITYVQAAR
jgi:hypothetical protein